MPLLMVLLTVVTGLVDAYIYLVLGHVFVANMTGNIVFLAFALGGAAGLVWWASLLAIAAFLLGAYLGGVRDRPRRRWASRPAPCRGAAVGQLGLFAVASVLAFTVAAEAGAEAPYGASIMAVLIVLLSIGMGMQNATARGLKVPQLTTTVLTLTIVGIAADRGPARRSGPRLISIGAMFAGAMIGVILSLQGITSWVLVCACLLLSSIAIVSALGMRSTAAWTRRVV